MLVFTTHGEARMNHRGLTLVMTMCLLLCIISLNSRVIMISKFKNVYVKFYYKNLY